MHGEFKAFRAKQGRQTTKMQTKILQSGVMFGRRPIEDAFRGAKKKKKKNPWPGEPLTKNKSLANNPPCNALPHIIH